MGTLLDGYPWWSQLTDPDPGTGRPDVFSTTDCGEEVVSIWIAGKTGKYTDAADLRRELVPPRLDGRTSGADLAALLSQHMIKAEPRLSRPWAVQSIVKPSVAAGDPVAVLGFWVSIKVLHWVLAVGFGNDAMLAMEPWTGRLVAYRWLVVHSLATGDLVQQSSS